MIKCVPILVDQKHGEYAVGYERPGHPGQVVPLVTGIYTQAAADSEAERLNAQARARQNDAFIEHSLRGTARGWYTDEMP